jgi:hypothetical protein
MFLSLPASFLFLRKTPVCYLYHMWLPIERNHVSLLCSPGHCLGFLLLFFTWLWSVLQQLTGLLIKTTQEVAWTVFLFSTSMVEIKTRDWQLFSLLVVRLETTRARGTWFWFNVFLQLTRTICSSSFGICLRMRKLPQYSPDSQINSLGFETNSENSAQQWHVVQFFHLFLQHVKERQIDS